jgi:hypothetical protein
MQKQLKTSSLFEYQGTVPICFGCKHRNLEFVLEPCKSCITTVSPSKYVSVANGEKQV